MFMNKMKDKMQKRYSQRSCTHHQHDHVDHVDQMAAQRQPAQDDEDTT